MGRRVKELDPLIAAARDQGWQVELTGNSHLKFIPADPKQPMIFSGTTTSDVRSIRNLRSQLRRAGLKDVKC